MGEIVVAEGIFDPPRHADQLHAQMVAEDALEKANHNHGKGKEAEDEQGGMALGESEDPGRQRGAGAAQTPFRILDGIAQYHG